MLMDLLMNLITAIDAKDAAGTERAYKALERVGVDKLTADTLIAELRA